MFQIIMRRLGIMVCRDDKNTNGASVNSRALDDLAKAKKTRGFSDLGRKRDEGFGKLIKALSKE